jgi:hypothetical protein
MKCGLAPGLLTPPPSPGRYAPPPLAPGGPPAYDLLPRIFVSQLEVGARVEMRPTMGAVPALHSRLLGAAFWGGGQAWLAWTCFGCGLLRARVARFCVSLVCMLTISRHQPQRPRPIHTPSPCNHKQVGQLSPAAEAIIRRCTSGIGALSPAAVLGAAMTGELPWGLPDEADYCALLEESEYAAWWAGCYLRLHASRRSLLIVSLSSGRGAGGANASDPGESCTAPATPFESAQQLRCAITTAP